MAAAAVRAGTHKPELDGIRGVAIALVVFAHVVQGVSPSNRGLAPAVGSLGGLAGVQLFFVLSGYLITGILLRGGGLGGFYARRVRRLYPTLLVVSAVVLVATRDVGGVLSAVTYTENVSQQGGWLGHTWSLAVEEQFYLAWPLVLLVAGRWAKHAAVVGIVATVAAQQVVSPEVAYGMLRWDAILAGCLLALGGWKASRGVTLSGLAVLAAYTLGVGPHAPVGFTITTLASVVAVAGAHHLGALSSGWLGHLGRISYALYLWHVIALRVDLPTVVTLPAGWLLAELTWRLVDRRASGREHLDRSLTAGRPGPDRSRTRVTPVRELVGL